MYRYFELGEGITLKVETTLEAQDPAFRDIPRHKWYNLFKQKNIEEIECSLKAYSYTFLQGMYTTDCFVLNRSQIIQLQSVFTSIQAERVMLHISDLD